ncbi:MAG TPA: helix-turn-helix transcriptional regulator [Candidatus Limnocylindrales bacterium]|nr:helix-turn-helix transcriptional regulator [Candidatus Limnocylindrales bacterium]
MPESGGAALKRAIHVARARTDYTSDMALAKAAGVHYDTLMNWFADKTTPRPFEVRKVAVTLGVSMADLLAAWEGRDPDPPPVQDAIRELVDELRAFVSESRMARAQQDEATMAILRALGALARVDLVRPGTPVDSEPEASADSARS